jgi:hypothetical protein
MSALGLSLGLPFRPKPSPSGGSSFNPLDYFTGGYGGLQWSGVAGESDFLQTEAGAVAGNGNPLGWVEDLSPNGNHLNQTVGAARSVCFVSGGSRAIQQTSNTEILPCTLAAAMNGVYSHVSIITPGIGAKLSFPSIYTTGNDYIALDHGVNEATVYINNNVIAVVSFPAASFIMHMVHESGAANGVTISTYDVTGTLVDTASGTNALINRGTAFQVGFGFGTPALLMSWGMEINRAITKSQFENDGFLTYLTGG